MNRGFTWQVNRFLAALPPEDCNRLVPQLELVSFDQQQVLYNPNDPLDHVFFPLDCLCSQVVMLANGEALETNIIGREGMVGVRVALGEDYAFTQTVIQIAGEALRLRSAALLAMDGESLALHGLLLRSALSLWNQTALAALCNRRHSVAERFARWLLTAQDRTERSRLPLTHQFLALMLGVRRVSVTTTGAILQRAGFVRLLRGQIEILDRAGLEGIACECYGLMRNQAERVFL
jgi:CRP-like cAMP-binding protein